MYIYFFQDGVHKVLGVPRALPGRHPKFDRYGSMALDPSAEDSLWNAWSPTADSPWNTGMGRKIPDSFSKQYCGCLVICIFRPGALHNSNELRAVIPAKWHTVIGDPTLGDAILDRLVHCAHKMILKGESLRKKKKPHSISESQQGVQGTGHPVPSLIHGHHRGHFFPCPPRSAF